MTIFCFEVLSGRRAEHPELWGIDESWRRAWRIDPVSLDPELAPWDSLLVDEDKPEEMPGDFVSYDVHLLGADEDRFYGAYEWTRESGYEDWFFAFDRRGQVLWSVAGDVEHPRTASAIITDRRRVFVSHPDIVVAYDALSGEQVWTSEATTVVTSVTEDGQFLWGVSEGIVSRFATDSGEVLLQEDLSSIGARFAVEFGGVLIVGADEDLLGYALPSMDHKWTVAYGTPSLVEGRWSFSEGVIYVLVWDVGGQTCQVMSVDAAGNSLWAEPVPDAFIGTEPPFIVDYGRASVLVLSNESEVSRLARFSSEGEEFTRDTPGRVKAAPPWGAQYLFVATDQSLYRVDGRGSFHAPWRELQEAEENWMGSIWGAMTFEVVSLEERILAIEGELRRSTMRFR